MEIIIIKIAICFCFYILGAYATTDILRLVDGADSREEVSGRGCFCPSCGIRIPLYHQIPIISFLLGRGKCRGCGSKIPAANFYLELFIFTYMTSVSVITDFAARAWVLCMIVYEATKVIMLLHYGGRKTHFWRNLLKSLGLNMAIFLLLGFLFLVRNIA